MRKANYAIFVLFALGTIAVQSNAVGCYNRNNPQQGTRSSTYTIDQLRNGILRKHNEYRAKHSVDPLQLDTELNNNAQNWADTIIDTEDHPHQTDSGYGENIFIMTSTGRGLVEIRPEDPVSSWYNEGIGYDYSVEPRSLEGIGHFTQVVWKNSKYLGVGVAKKPGKTVVVTTYSPHGNVMGHIMKNVLRPK